MTAAPHQWSTTAADNRSADTRGKLPTGIPASALDDAIIALMQSAALARDDRTGVLLATVNSANVYSVATNEGLIDPATQVGGATGKISKPFILRVALPALTAPVGGTTPAPPMIAIDGAAAVPLKTTLGGAIADGDIPATRVFVILGDTIASGAYGRARILDLLPSDIKALIPAPTASAAKSLLIPGAPNTLPGFGQSKVTTFGTPDDATGGSAAGLASFSAGRLTIGPNGAGVWGLGLGLSAAAPSGVNYGLLAGLYRNGGSNPEVTAEFVNSSIIYFGMQPISGLYPVRCAAGDYFDCYEIVNYQSSGTITISVKIAAVYLGA